MEKLMCISDIHGNIECLKQIMVKYRDENADKLLILGDFFSYGFLSSSAFEVAELLNNISRNIIAVKGNCDSSRVDDLFHFTLPYTRNFNFNDITLTLTHGHIYNKNNLPENCGQVFLSGHTHIGFIEKVEDRIIANPGSISKARGGSQKSYLTIAKDKILLKNLQGEIIKSTLID